MIGSVRGTVVERAASGEVLVEVGGVGYRVHVPVSALPMLHPGDAAFLFTHLHVREDAMVLYGFPTRDERDTFEALIAASGVGPKVALGIVSGSTPVELRRAIVRDDTARFEAIPGIGRKTAQRVILELKEKIGAYDLQDGTAQDAGGSLLARNALVELGWSMLDAERALAEVDEELPVEEQVRAALRQAA